MRHKIRTLILSLVFVFTANIISAQTYQWSKSFGSTFQDRVFDLTTDSIGNVYTVGHFSLTADFDPGTGIHLLSSSGTADIFVSVVDKYGNFLWAQNFGGKNFDYGNSITLDNSGNVLISGEFRDTVDFDPGPGVAQVISSGISNYFILKLDAAGNFLWVKRGAISTTTANSDIITDSSGNIYLAGVYGVLTDFDPGPALFNMSPVGAGDIFVMKLDPMGNFVWAKSIGGYSFDRCQSIALDSAGNVITAGSFRYQGDFDPGPGVFNLNAPTDAMFISKLDSAGNFIWAKSWGMGYCWAMTVDSIGNIYTTGVFGDTSDFDPGPAVYNLICDNTQDPFISKFDVNGNFLWARALSGSGWEEAHSICVGHNGKVYTAGTFTGTMDFDPGPNMHNLTPLIQDNVYLSVLDSSGNFLNAIAIDGSNTGWGGSGETVSVDAEDNLFLTGAFSLSVDFNPPFGANMISNGSQDVFIIKYGYENVGVSENHQSNSISVYPNPGNGDYFVDFESSITGILTVTNILGQEIINEKLDNTSSYQLNLEVTDGIYFLRIFKQDQCYTVKLLKD